MHRMKTPALLSAVTLAITTLVLPTASASLSECPVNHMCMWGNNDFQWKIADLVHGQSNWRNLTGERNDEMDSWANRSAVHNGCMTSDANGGGDRQTMWMAKSDSNVAPWNSDEVSSYRTYNGCR